MEITSLQVRSYGSWGRGGLIQCDWFPHRKKKTACEQADTQGECHVPTKTEPGVWQLQAQDCQEPQKPGGGGKGSPPSLRGSVALPAPGLWASSLQNERMNFCCRPVCITAALRNDHFKCDTCPLSETHPPPFFVLFLTLKVII